MTRWLLLSLALTQIEAAPVTSLAFSPDGSVLAAATGDQIRLLAPDTGETTLSLTWSGMRAVTLALQPGGSLLAVGGGVPGEGGSVRLLDWRQKKWISSSFTGDDVVTCVAFHPDGTRLIITNADHTAQIFRVKETGRGLTKQVALTGHSGPVTAAAFSPDGKLVVTTSMDRSLKVWSADDGKLLRSLGQHTDAVHALVFRPGVPAECASGGDERNVRVWQPAIGRMVRIVRHHEGSVLALAFAPDGHSLFSAGHEGIVREIDAGSDTVLHEWHISDDWIYSLAVSPDGQTLASGDWAGQVKLQKLKAQERDHPDPSAQNRGSR